jgi:transcription termination factor Rho
MVLAIAVGLGVSGCKPKNEPPEVLSVQGRIENIKVADNGGEITVAYFNERQNQEMVGTALVTAQTEIMINGAAAKLSDLRNGERVRGDVRVEKRDNQRTLTALKIYADRADVQPAAPKPQEQNAPGGGS